MSAPRARTTALFLFLGLAAATSAPDTGEGAALDGLRVLVVSPDAASGPGRDLADLLVAHGAEATPALWAQAGRERARVFDLVVVTGTGRRVAGTVVLDYETPVLGVGSYGYSYFGRAHLKHGAPYS